MKKPLGEIPKHKWVIYTDTPLTESATPSVSLSSPGQHIARSGESIVAEGKEYLCRLNPAVRHAFITGLYDLVTGAVAQHVLRSEMLLPVTQINIIKAARTNASLIRIDMETIGSDIPSPFITSKPWFDKAPHSLWPTELQKHVSHHPWIDLIPMASFRDSLLRNDGNYDDNELCHDMYASCGSEQIQTGVLLWGEAWDPTAYEFSESFIHKWRWLFHGCAELIRSSNYWRAQRGEKHIFL